MEHPTPRRLTRSHDRLLGGVAAGVGDYLDVDPTLVRVGWVIAVVVGLPLAVLAYLVLWVIMPLEDGTATRNSGARGDRRGRDSGALVLGVAMVLVGALFLLPDVHFVPWLGWRLIHFAWPAILIVGGVLLLMRSSRAAR